ncbi:MerC family mercury resistance protein [Pantoea ananatis]|uniref:MerC family mercury resistance protein n=1 Tax=Pantoea ananas TaxID=553 RepID=UPI0039B8DBA1
MSGLCLLHCLALPLLAAALPLFGVWAEAEWVHVVFVAIAAPLAGLALWRGHRRDPCPGRYGRWRRWACSVCWRAPSAFPTSQRNRDDGERQPGPGQCARGTGAGTGSVAH